MKLLSLVKSKRMGFGKSMGAGARPYSYHKIKYGNSYSAVPWKAIDVHAFPKDSY